VADKAHRFALVAPNYYPVTCGVGDHSMRLAAELARRGHEAMVFSREPATTNPEASNVRVRGVPGRTPLSIALRAAREIDGRSFSHAILEYTPQMWGARRFGSPALPLLAALLRRRGLRVVVIMHELATPWCVRPDLAVGAAMMRAQFHALLPLSHLLFVTTESAREVILRSPAARFLAHPPRVMPIAPNALPTPAAPVPGRHRLGLFSTLAVGKSFDLVIAAFEEIATRYPDAELVLIGDLGSPGNPRLTALQSRMARSPVGSRIQVTGKLALGDVAAAVGSLDAYLFPMNTGANTRSGTLPVALGSGVPVIAVRGAETDPLFEHRRNILFADAFTGPAFARAALELFGDRTLAGRLSEGGRALYREALSWERTATMLLEAIDRDQPQPDRSFEARAIS